MTEPRYVTRNREVWTKTNAEYTDERAREGWAKEEITWGMFGVPEAQLDVLGDVTGKDVIELGCGTGYFGAWLARRGARVTGVDITPAQLETARRCSEELGIPMELIEANAEEVPLPDSSFDLAISEYGASIWCDPYLWIPEAARLLRANGFDVERLLELQAPERSTDHSYYGFIPADWARKWPAEEIWVARKR